MSKEKLIKYGLFFVMVIVSIGAANTARKRVPVVGSLIDKVMAGV